MKGDQDENIAFGAVVSEQLSPGELLKRAREARKLSHIDIAKQLKLRTQWIIDIENDHYTDASALIYVRGYLRAYARVVNLPGEEIIAAFDQMKFDEPFLARRSASAGEEQFIVQRPVLSYFKSRSRRGVGKKLSAWIALAIVVLALLLIMMWWRGEHTQVNTQSAALQPQVTLPAIEATPSHNVSKQASDNSAAD